MESLSLCLSSSPLCTTHKPAKARLISLHLPTYSPSNSPSSSTRFNPIEFPPFSLPSTNPPIPSLSLPLFAPLLLYSSLPCFASELPLPAEYSTDKINLEAIVVAIDDFNNRNPFFVAGVTFIWLFVIPLIKAYLKKYKYISAIDAFRRLQDDPSAQLLAFLNSSNLKLLDKAAVQVHYSVQMKMGL